MNLDILVIGSGVVGSALAIKVSKLGYKVAIVDSNAKISGLIVGKGIMLILYICLIEMLKTRFTHNARVTVQTLFSGTTKLI